MTEEELEQKKKQKNLTKIYAQDKCVDLYEGYQFIDGFIIGAKSRDKEIEKLKSRLSGLNTYISQIKVLMNENIHCEEIYHHLECFLGMFEADEYDCECCHSEKCNKRLFFETTKEKQ